MAYHPPILMFPRDPLLPQSPFWTRTRTVSLLLAIWFVVIGFWHYPPRQSFEVAVTTITLMFFLWRPSGDSHHSALGADPINRYEAEWVDALMKILLWGIFLARIPWFLWTWSVDSWPKHWLND